MRPCCGLFFLLSALRTHFKKFIREWFLTITAVNKNFQSTDSLRMDLAV
jgi:hypothetical protein